MLRWTKNLPNITEQEMGEKETLSPHITLLGWVKWELCVWIIIPHIPPKQGRVRDAHLLARCAAEEVTNQQQHPETLPCTQWQGAMGSTLTYLSKVLQEACTVPPAQEGYRKLDDTPVLQGLLEQTTWPRKVCPAFWKRNNNNWFVYIFQF